MSRRDKKSAPALGIDIGGVLIRPARDSGDTSFFSSGYLETPIVDGAFEAVARLNKLVFPDRVFLVSKAKSGTAQKTVKWLAHRRFHETTGVPLERVHFCERREDKAIIAKRLRLTAFIDDRLDVLGHLAGVKTRILFAASATLAPAQTPPDGVQFAIGWAATLDLFSAGRVCAL
ncbi:MAG: hypothetical protein KBA31_02505 [Alphaproteobacteria bacterium]|nr:hypothetical protein [Alphaproteobacteria bacterium]